MRHSITAPLLVLLFLSLPEPERTQNWNIDAGSGGGDETPYNMGNRADPGSTPAPTQRSGWEWMPRDAFDEFIEEFDSVTAENCHLHRDARMDPDTLQAVTVFNDLIPVRSPPHAINYDLQDYYHFPFLGVRIRHTHGRTFCRIWKL